MTERHERALDSVVGALRRIPSVIAIASYGSTADRSWTEHSDVDLVAILDREPPAESIRLFVEGVPVDLNLRSAGGSRRGIGGADFVPEMEPLWDPDGLLGSATTTSRPGGRADARRLRYLLTHSIKKLRQLEGNIQASRINAAAECGYFVQAYFFARDETFPGALPALRRLQSEAPELLDALERALLRPERAGDALEEAAAIALGPVGGLWRPGDVMIAGWGGDGVPSALESESVASLFAPVIEASDPPHTMI